MLNGSKCGIAQDYAILGIENLKTEFNLYLLTKFDRNWPEKFLPKMLNSGENRVDNP